MKLRGGFVSNSSSSSWIPSHYTTDKDLKELVKNFISKYDFDYIDEYRQCLNSDIIDFIGKAKYLLEDEDED